MYLKVVRRLVPAVLTGLVWHRISLPYSNPESIVGPLSDLRFHPANNLLRYLAFVLSPALVWVMLSGRAWLVRPAASSSEDTSVPVGRLLLYLLPVWTLILCKLLLLYSPLPCIPCWDSFHLGERTVTALDYGLPSIVGTENFRGFLPPSCLRQ